MFNWLAKLSALISTRLTGKKPPSLALETSKDGLTISSGEENEFVPWSSVDRVTVFKRDQITVDMICVLISAQGKIFELNENMIGWSEASSAFETHLPGSMPWAEWTLKVMFPAFATNATEIYNKSGSAQKET